MASSTNPVLPLAPAPLQTYPYPGLDINDTQSPRIIGTCITLIVITTAAVALRFLARHLSRAGLWWDDWTILGALVRLRNPTFDSPESLAIILISNATGHFLCRHHMWIRRYDFK